MSGLLIDENLPPFYRERLRERLPRFEVVRVGDPDGPPFGTLDPDVLIWCETHDCFLVTDNRRSMQRHLNDHINMGRSVPGILSLHPAVAHREILDSLQDIVELSLPGEFANQIRFIPL